MRQFEDEQSARLDELEIKAEGVEQKTMKYKLLLLKSGLLEKIEETRLRNKNVHQLDLYPRSDYEDERYRNQFLKEPTYLHTQYFVRHSARYSSFCITVKQDGMYWESGEKVKPVNAFTVTDQEIDEWFALLKKK